MNSVQELLEIEQNRRISSWLWQLFNDHIVVDNAIISKLCLSNKQIIEVNHRQYYLIVTQS
jgi:hypothetical protein